MAVQVGFYIDLLYSIAFAQFLISAVRQDRVFCHHCKIYTGKACISYVCVCPYSHALTTFDWERIVCITTVIDYSDWNSFHNISFLKQSGVRSFLQKRGRKDILPNPTPSVRFYPGHLNLVVRLEFGICCIRCTAG